MIRTTDEDDLKNESKVLRGEVGSFDKHVAKILVAPAQAIERGYNIVDENGHSTFGSVFFLVRPMAVPDEISSKCAKLNGIIEKRFCSEKDTDAFKKAYELAAHTTTIDTSHGVYGMTGALLKDTRTGGSESILC